MRLLLVQRCAVRGGIYRERVIKGLGDAMWCVMIAVCMRGALWVVVEWMCGLVVLWAVLRVRLCLACVLSVDIRIFH